MCAGPGVYPLHFLTCPELLLKEGLFQQCLQTQIIFPFVSHVHN